MLKNLVSSVLSLFFEDVDSKTLDFPVLKDCTLDDLLSTEDLFRFPLPGHIGGNEAIAGEFFLEFVVNSL